MLHAIKARVANALNTEGHVRASQKRLIILLVAVATVPMILLSAVLAYLRADDDRTREQRRVVTRIDRIVERVNEALLAELQIAEALAALPSLEQGKLDLFHHTAQKIVAQRSAWETASLVGLDGQQMMNVLRPLGDPLGAVADQQTFQRVLKSQKSMIGGLGPVGPVTKKQLVSIFVPVMREGQLVSVFSVGIPPDQISEIFKRSGMPNDWAGAIFDVNEKIIVQSQNGPKLRASAMREARLIRSADGIPDFFEITQDDVSYSGIYRILPDPAGWSIYFAIPTEKLNSSVSKSTWYLVLMSGLAIIISASVAHSLAHNIDEARRSDELIAQLKVESSEARTALATTAADLGTWRLYASKMLFAGSSRTRDLLGLEDSAHVGADYFWNVQDLLNRILPEDRNRVEAVLDETIRHPGPLSIEFRIAEEGQPDRWLRLVGNSLPGTSGDETNGSADKVVHGVLADVHVLRTAETQRVQLLRRLAQEQEAIQRRIARELHDQVGQTLTGMSLGLTKLKTLFQSDSDQRHVDELLLLTKQMSRDIHRVATDLRPLVLDDLGLKQALQALADDLSARHDVEFSVHVSEHMKSLPSEIETAAFRVVQEAFTNVLKHANAMSASAIINIYDDELRIVVDDDGVGLPPEQVHQSSISDRPRKGHFSSIRERLAALGGSLQVETWPGRGLSLFMMIPLEQNPVIRNANSSRSR